MLNIQTYENIIRKLEDELKDSRTAVEELKILNEIAIAAGRATDVDQTLNIVLNRTIKAVNAEHGALLLVSENQKDVLNTLIRQDNTSRIKEDYHLSKEVTGWILLNKMNLIIKDLSEDIRFKPSPEEKENIRSLICSPIWFEGKIMGVLQMINKKSNGSIENIFTDYDLTLLSIISVQTGQLIKNSQMQQEAAIKSKEADIARLESEKLQDLDKLKTIFFNNISHEFRTPLTLIAAPTEKIISLSSDEKITREAKIIKQNSIRLLQLINQLLELSKLESGKLKLHASKGNIVSFTKGIVLSFESLAEDKDIHLNFSPEKDFIELYYDSDKITKILTNLLSNAFKFTPEEGTIIVSVSEAIYQTGKAVKIKVRDTGVGIKEEELPKLFDRYYQVDKSIIKEYSGSGIGLALTKELVELHRGKISAVSKAEEWTEFTIMLPCGRDHLKDEEVSDNKEFEKEPAADVIYYSQNNIEFENTSDATSINNTIILLVEDNYDMRKYIKESLLEKYRVEEAISGEQGVRKAEKIIPDLIISDMIMPKMGGSELTKILKNDERTSHIPIILLTAKADAESKLEGLKTGADEYLTKPFDTTELLIRIENLISNRKKMHERLNKGEFRETLKSSGLPKPMDTLRKIDVQFINKVMKVIEDNISEENFTIEDFGSEVGMSRTQLHRKLKALTGKSPSLYLRSARLARAKEMIIEEKGNISEIAYSVGFSSPAYFTKCFKEEFGYPPSETVR